MKLTFLFPTIISHAPDSSKRERARRKSLSIIKEKLNNFKYFNIYVCNLMMKSVSEREREREKVNFATVAIAATIVTRRTDEENGIE